MHRRSMFFAAPAFLASGIVPRIAEACVPNCMAPGNSPIDAGNITLVCAWIIQSQEGPVEVQVYNRQAVQINKDRPNHHLQHKTEGWFCIGRESFFAQAYWIVWCNYYYHSIFSPADVAKYLAQGRTAQGHWVDLRWRPTRRQNIAPWTPPRDIFTS